jgi:hypothetical protein
MTLEPDRDTRPKENTRFTYGKRRRRAALRRAHKREKKQLEQKESAGLDLTDREKNRLELLRDTYD